MRLMIALTLLLGPGCATVQSPEPAALIVRNVSVIDPASGRVQANQSVRVEGERITAVGPSNRVSARGARVIDGSGKYVVPGLWDMHAHLQRWGFQKSFPMLVGNGVLGVRDMSSENLTEPAAAIAEAKAGTVPSVRLIAPGRRLDGPTHPKFRYRIIVRTPEEAREAVRKQAAAGAAFIKVHSKLDKAMFMAVADETKKQNIRFAGHIPNSVSGIEAANAGIWTAEHGTGLPGCEKEPCPELDATVEAFNRHNVWVVPTMAQGDAELRVYSGTIPAEEWALVNVDVKAIWNEFLDINADFLPPVQDRLKNFQAGTEGAKRNVGMWYRKGLKILAGTDLGGHGTLPGFSLQRELELLVEAGLPPLDALRAATSSAVAVLGLEKDLGSVEAGKYADFLILNGNPLESISETRNIYGVVANGRPYMGEERRRLLAWPASGLR